MVNPLDPREDLTASEYCDLYRRVLDEGGERYAGREWLLWKSAEGTPVEEPLRMIFDERARQLAGASLDEWNAMQAA